LRIADSVLSILLPLGGRDASVCGVPRRTKAI
jgi:hypothetical protein